MSSSDLDPDAEHIERLRHVLLVFERWRWWLIGLSAALFVGLVAGVLLLLKVLAWIQPPKNQAPGFLGFGLGMTLGISAGLLASKVGHLLGWAFFGFRNERLLVRYHDAIQTALSDTSEHPQAEAGGRKQ